MHQDDETFEIKLFEKNDIRELTDRFSPGLSRKEIRVAVETLLKKSDSHMIYLAKEGDDRLLCGFDAIEPVSNQTSAWIMSPQLPVAAGSSLFLRALSFLLYEGFHQKRLHKISFCVEESDSAILEMLDSCQFRKEGVLSDHFRKNGVYSSGILYAMTKSEFVCRSTAMVPFLNGYLLVRAAPGSVFSISILKNGQDLPEYVDETCGYKDKASRQGKVTKPLNADTYYRSENAFPYLIHAADQLFQYTKGHLKNFDLVYEYYGATEFQKQVWQAAAKIPYGQTRTYEEIAFALKPKEKMEDLRIFCRAVGTALGKNPVLIAIPCHRVIGKDGKLKGFAAGLEVKDYLLSHEMLF